MGARFLHAERTCTPALMDFPQATPEKSGSGREETSAVQATHEKSAAGAAVLERWPSSGQVHFSKTLDTVWEVQGVIAKVQPRRSSSRAAALDRERLKEDCSSSG